MVVGTFKFLYYYFVYSGNSELIFLAISLDSEVSNCYNWLILTMFWCETNYVLSGYVRKPAS